jgi:hypothetical protein
MSARLDAAALQRQLEAAIARALTAVLGTFQAEAEVAYAGTRFAGTFAVQPAVILRTASLVNAAPLLHVVEYPTAAHAIVARSAPALVFYWQRAGRWVRTGAVNHPGTRGRQAIAPLHQAAFARLGALLATYLDDLNRAA